MKKSRSGFREYRQFICTDLWVEEHVQGGIEDAVGRNECNSGTWRETRTISDGGTRPADLRACRQRHHPDPGDRDVGRRLGRELVPVSGVHDFRDPRRGIRVLNVVSAGGPAITAGTGCAGRRDDHCVNGTGRGEVYCAPVTDDRIRRRFVHRPDCDVTHTDNDRNLAVG